jgi:glycine/D-amino acid oxidase-like deaminating enzyme
MTYVKPRPEERCKFTDVAEKWRGGCHNKARANGFCHVHGGVDPRMPDLTLAERKLLKALLEMAAEAYSNHGCNDFRLRKDAGLTDAEAQEVTKLFEAWDHKVNPVGAEPYAPDTEYLMDWLLMRWMASKFA